MPSNLRERIEYDVDSEFRTRSVSSLSRCLVGDRPMSASVRPGSEESLRRSAKDVALPKTPWGDPDLQGVWNDATSTPLQRPGYRGREGRAQR